MTAADVDGWDSMMTINLMIAIENSSDQVRRRRAGEHQGGWAEHRDARCADR
jgi:hypothetical protein